MGQTRLMVLADTPQRVQVGDDKTLAFEQLSSTELSLKAKTVGTTELNLWFPDPTDPSKHKILSYLVRVFLIRRRRNCSAAISRRWPTKSIGRFPKAR